jgi:cytochrome c-type biogenesis protein CcmF
MFIGNLSLILTLIAVVFSSILFLLAARGNKNYLKLARDIYLVAFFFSTIATAYLFYLFLAHRFEVSYVYNYSSSDLPLFYLISSFWAGQEGTFLLWLFLGLLLGLFLLKKSEEMEGWTMFFYLLIQIFLLALLLKKSPFALEQGLPPEGKGLNPLLQDFWMVIHPPVVFLGYAALEIPFALALAGLASKKFEKWLSLAFPWTAFSVLSLGAGIFIGGYWAYKVLGWGGYWGWDPVENASAIPWFTSIALLHGLILQKNRNVLKKTNLALALVSFLLIMYGTFLTRSGILSKFSVHSFEDLGINAYLSLFMILFLLISLILFIRRTPEIKGEKSGKEILTSEFVILLSIIFLAIFSAMVLFGTSAPIITGILGTASNVSTLYYVRTSLPLGILIAFVLGISAFVLWKKRESQEFLQKILIPLIATVILTILAFILGVRNPLYLVFLLFSLWAFVANLFLFLKKLKTKTIYWGSYLAHIGIGLMLIGILTSSGYNTSQKLNLPLGEKKEAYGYKFEYQGEEIGKKAQDSFLKIGIEKDGKSFLAKPHLYFSEYNQGIMRKPDIKMGFSGDLYLAPLEHQGLEPDNENLLILHKGEGVHRGDYHITFLEFDMSSHQGSGGMKVGAKLEVEYKNETSNLTPYLLMGKEEGPEKMAVPLPGGVDSLKLEKIDADNKAVLLRFIGSSFEKSTGEYLILELSKKPLIWVLWLGTILVMMGLFLSTWRRAKELKP